MIQKSILIITLLFMVLSCQNTTNPKHDSWESIDIPIDSNCNFYMMYFSTGDYIFRISSSGQCLSLTKELFLKQYDQLLKEHQNKIPLKYGKIIFDYDSFEKDSIFTNDLMRLTNFYYKTTSKMIENSKERIVIEIYKE